MPNHVVLLVEDDPETLDVMTAVLRDAGYDVLTAAHEEAALAQLAAHARVDVIITDVCYDGGSSGSCMAENVRRLGSTAPIVVTSSDPDAQCMTLGAGAAFLHKPYGRDALLVAVATALAGRITLPIVRYVRDAG